MKKIAIALLTAIMFISCSKDEETVYSSDEQEILDLINDHRASIGKSALGMDATIYKISMEHSKNMANGTVPFGHDGFSERVEEIKETHGNGAAAENVAYGYSSPEAVVNGWLNSSGHKANIEGNYTICGIAIAEDEKGVPYYTHMFFNK